MKKLALSLAVLFAVGMVSCGGNKDKENCADTTVTEGVEVLEAVPGDSANGDSTQVVGATVTETTTTPETKADAKEEVKEEKADAAAPAADAAAPAETPAPEAAK